MSVIGGIASAVGSKALDVVGGAVGSKVQDYFSAKQYRRMMRDYKKRYQYTTADMRKAGLNPILAATGGFSVGQTPSMPSTPGPNFGGSSNIASSAEALAETDKAQKETELIGKKVQTEIAQAAKTRAEKGLITAQERSTVIGVQKIVAETQKAYKEAYLAIEKRDLTEAETRNLQTITAKTLLEMEKLARIAGVYKAPVGKWITYVNEVREALGVNFNVKLGK